MRVVLLVALLLAGAAGAAPKVGQRAPDFSLPRIKGEGTVSLGDLRGHPLVVWFPDLTPHLSEAITHLREAMQDCHAILVVVPVVGPDAQGAAPLADQFPDLIMLHDAEGATTLGYTGEFIPGVAPGLNLILVDSGGTIRAMKVYPGIPLHLLTSLLSGLP